MEKIVIIFFRALFLSFNKCSLRVGRKNISKPLFIDIAGLFTKTIVQTYLLEKSLNHNDIL